MATSQITSTQIPPLEMNCVKPPAKILVTGVSGYIAAWVVRDLLERGYTVRGTVRSIPQGEWIVDYFKAYSPRFEYVVVNDIEIEGAFKEAVQGIDAVVHMASPLPNLHESNAHPNALIGPAVNGTVGILQAILEVAPSVKRVVLTSSIAAVLEPHSPPYCYTKADWNDYSIKHSSTSPNQLLKYFASKTLAERAAWRFMADNKEKINFDLVTILPAYVIGPAIHQITALKKISGSVQTMLDGIEMAGKSTSELTTRIGGFVDVRDVAFIHAQAVSASGVAGERIIASSDNLSWQELCDALNGLSVSGIPKGQPGIGQGLPFNTFETDKARELLGRDFRSLGESARETIMNVREIAARIDAGNH